MKIIDVTTTVVNAEMRNWVFVKIATDQGLYGWGEATLEWKTRAVVGAIDDLKPILLGRDPRDIRQNVRALVKHGFWKVGAIGMTAISGLEHAMWDIFGKSVGLPVWRLLGGKVAPETLRLVEQSVAGAKSLRFDLALRQRIASARANGEFTVHANSRDGSLALFDVESIKAALGAGAATLAELLENPHSRHSA